MSCGESAGRDWLLLGIMAVLAALGLTTLPLRLQRVVAAGLAGLAVVQVSSVTSGIPPNVSIPWLGTR